MDSTKKEEAKNGLNDLNVGLSPQKIAAKNAKRPIVSKVIDIEKKRP